MTMGCDIHVHTEIKLDGVWEHYGSPDVDRNYLLFEKMAGVRGDSANAISAPKGLPDEAAKVTKFACDVFGGDDGHSHSWLSSQEIEELYVWWEKKQPFSNWTGGYGGIEQQFGYLFGNAWMKENMPERVTDFRWIFWFDN
jgi:hypothetical protein